MSNAPHTEPRTVVSDNQPLSIEDPRTPPEVCPHPRLSTKPALSARGAVGAAFSDRLLHKDHMVDGMSTGDGDSCMVEAPLEWFPDLLRHPHAHRGCDAGCLLSLEAICATLASPRGRTRSLSA